MSEKTTLIQNDSDAKTGKRYGTVLYTFSNTYLMKKQCVIACGVVLILVMIFLVILFFGLASLLSDRHANEIAKTKKAFENDIRFPNGMNYTEYVNFMRNIVPDDDQRWIDGIVYYSIDSSFKSGSVKLIKDTLRQMSEEIGYRTDGQKCITFKQRTDSKERNYLNFIQDDGCWSYIGMHGGEQHLSIGDGCHWKGIILHEVMHALGFWHEHVRPDRDQYVTIHRQNIEPTQAYNFDKLLFTRVMTPFDTDSILIYDNYAFSVNGEPTITANDGKELVHAYLKPSLTGLNRQAIRLLYKCSEPVTDATIITTNTTTEIPSTLTITSTMKPITSSTTKITTTTTTSTMKPSTSTTISTMKPTTTTTTSTMKPTTSTTTSTMKPTTNTPIPTSTTTTTTSTTTTTTSTTTTTTTMKPIITSTIMPTTITSTVKPTIPSTIKPTTITSTMKPTTTTTEISDFVCERDGYFANPRDCSRFYRCVQTAQGFTRYQFICSLGTVWSNFANTCVHGTNNNCPQ